MCDAFCSEQAPSFIIVIFCSVCKLDNDSHQAFQRKESSWFLLSNVFILSNSAVSK